MSTPIKLSELCDGRLRLRRMDERDVAAVTAICQDEEIQRWTRVPSPYTEEDGRGYLELSRSALEEGRGAHLLVVDGADRILGSVGLSIDAYDRDGEVGYWVAPDARGRGVAAAASRLMIRWGFDELGLDRCTLKAATTNLASNAVAERLGFTHEGVLREAFLVGLPDERHRVDANVWGLLPGELR